MKNRWQQSEADQQASRSTLGLRVYSSQLMGQEEDLVLHGGGNTSMKGSVEDVFGETIDVLYVKGSGWDLRTIEEGGFPPVRLAHLQRLAGLDSLSDSEMMRQLRLGLMDPGAPTPSVEAILHALIPWRYVDHSHADAVVTLSNTPDGEQRLRELYGDEVLVLPYLMPGFILARQVAAATAGLDWERLRGIVLMHHGLFTFADDAKTSYDSMIELVSKAEQALRDQAGLEPATADSHADRADLLTLSRLRKQAGSQFGGPVLLRLDDSPEAAGFAGLPDCGELIARGPLTPDHSIHAKAFGADFGKEPLAGLSRFAENYRAYFEAHGQADQQCLDPMPRYGIWRDRGLVYLAPGEKRLQVVEDISRHTIAAIQRAEAVSRWEALPRESLFEVEYWELEQAKLKRAGGRPPWEGRVALVTGAASGIGRACVQSLRAAGAVVLALDIDSGGLASLSDPAILTIPCDVCDEAAVSVAIEQGVRRFGGIDMLVSNAGSFPASASIEDLDSASWERSMELNLNSHRRLLQQAIPFLRAGFDPAVVIVASKNVPAPGPGAAAYSVAKAGLTQLARVAALELAADGIRVNVLHPNAVYDTALWTEEVLAERASRYGLSVEDYKRANLLGSDVTSSDVATLVLAMLGPAFARTTGAQIPVDGGNERVI